MKLTLAVVIMATIGFAQDRSGTGRSEAVGNYGMAATSQPLATLTAIEILKAGGSAVDAAIAANALLALVEPVSCGPGGDLFAIVWDARSGRLYGLNGSGRSPASLTLQEFRTRNLSRIPSRGPLPVTVPGCVDGWFTLHGRFGRLPMREILAPAIRYAREGFPLTAVIARAWEASVPVFSDYPNFKETFTIGGRAPRHGERFRNPALGATLEAIAHGGRDAFYEGEIATVLDRFMKRMGGYLSREDLARHRSEWVEPVSTRYRGYDVWELPPNGQGIAVLQMLNILEGYDLKALGFGSPAYAHLFLEAKKLAFEDRARFYGDPAFGAIPVKQLISKPYAEARRRLIDTARAGRSYEAGNPALDEGDTIYLTVADGEGNMVSLIQSNFRGMGSGMVPDGLGFMLQDRGELFNLEEGHPNSYAPDKRPFHTIIPAFVTRDGLPVMSFGVMGGSFQPLGQVQVLVNIIDFGMNLQEAGDAPRMSHTGSSEPTGERMLDGGSVSFERGFSAGMIDALRAKGHRIAPAAGEFGGYQAIRVDPARKVYIGATESRKDGIALGY